MKETELYACYAPKGFKHGSRCSPRRQSIDAVFGKGLTVSVIFFPMLLPAQVALKNSLTGETATETQRAQAEDQPYTFKSGDFRMLLAPSFGVDWNNNVTLSQSDRQHDFILTPSLGVTSSYPLTDGNLLLVNATVGYRDYVRDTLPGSVFVETGSQLSFDIAVGDFKINLHERINVVQDDATTPEVSNTGDFGTFNNTAGLLTTWELRDATLSLGYDHTTMLTTTGQYNNTDHSADSVLARAGFNVHPKITVGVEGTVSYTAYDQNSVTNLNNSTAYSAGVYGDFRPATYIHIQPRAGYTLYEFQQTASIPASDENGWYVDLTLTHEVAKFLSYSVSAGHEISIGFQSNTTEDWYARPNLTWSFIKSLSVTTGFFYERGTLTGGSLPGTTETAFNWYGGNLTLGCEIIKNLSASLNYRVTERSSNVSTDGYAQNEVGLFFTYTIK